MTWHRYGIFGVFMLLLLGCHAEEAKPLMSKPQTSASTTQLIIPGFIEASRSQNVTPDGSGWKFRLEYLIPEYTEVQPGTKLAVFQSVGDQNWWRQLQDQLREAVQLASDRLVQLERELVDAQEREVELGKQIRVLEASTGDASLATLLNKAPVEQKKERLELEKLKLERKNMRQRIKLKKRLIALKREVHAVTLSNAQQRQEQIALARESISVEAEFAGVVIYRNNPHFGRPETGKEIYKGIPVLSVVDNDNFYVEAYLPEKQRGNVRTGQKVTLALLGRRDARVTGTVERISQIVQAGGAWRRDIPARHPLRNAATFFVQIRMDAIPAGASPGKEVVVILKRDASLARSGDY